MQDILFSRQQFDAIISRLEGLKLDMIYLKRQKEIQGTPPQSERLDAAEVMCRFHISKSTLLRWCKKGEIPFERIGGRVFFEAERVFDFARKMEGGGS